MNEIEQFDEAVGRDVTFAADIHQEMHYLIIKFDGRYRVEELTSSFLIHSLIIKELLRDILEKDYWLVVESFVGAPVVDAIYQADVALFLHFEVY